MKIYLMRHAMAVPRGTPGYANDAERPLTMEGHAQAREVAEGLRRLKVAPGVIASSPYVRAIQTAERVAKVLGPHLTVKEVPELRGEARPAETSLALKSLAMYERVLCVGHEPHLSAWLAELVAGRQSMTCQMKKAGVACVEADLIPPPAGSATLRWLMTPKQLTLIGKAG